MMRSKIHLVVIIGILVFASVRLFAAESSEYELKAAFIFNFAKFVEWVNRSDIDQINSLPLCLLGEDPFGVVIDKLEGKKVYEYAIHIKRIASINDHSGCRILFISQSETDKLPKLFDVLNQKKGILTISDIKGFANGGGVIELVLNENRIRFIVNIAAAKKADLYLSSKILRLANVVGGDWGEN
jgi:hypothetical protein